MDVTLKLRCNLPSNVYIYDIHMWVFSLGFFSRHATGVVVRIPVPKSTTK